MVVLFVVVLRLLLFGVVGVAFVIVLSIVWCVLIVSVSVVVLVFGCILRLWCFVL